MAASRATVEILATLKDGVSAPLKGLRGALASVTTGIRGLVTAGLVVSFANAAKNVALADVQMVRFAESIGETVQEVSRLKFALDTIGKGDGLKELLNQLTGKVGDAVRAPGQTRSAFGQLGVDIQELRSLGAVEILKQLADGYKFAGDRAIAASNLQAIFGDQFREFLPLLSQGRTGLDELGRTADRLGATISAEDALNAKEFARNWAEFQALSSGLFRELANTLLPRVNSILREVFQLLRGSSPEQRRDEAAAIARRQQGERFIFDLSDEARETLKSFGGIIEEFPRDFSQVSDPSLAPRRSQLVNPGEVLARINSEREAEQKAARESFQKAQQDARSGESFFAGFRQEIASTNAELAKMNNLGAQTAKALQNAFSSNITAAIRAVRTGALSVKDALDSLLDGLLDDIAEFATQELVKRLISAGLSFIGAGASGGGSGTNPDIGPPTAASSGGGTGLLSFGGGLKRLGGGGTTINVFGAQTREEQIATTAAIVRDQIARNRQVRLDVRAV